jgi:hypothetical protein
MEFRDSQWICIMIKRKNKQILVTEYGWVRQRIIMNNGWMVILITKKENVSVMPLNNCGGAVSLCLLKN